ncbi:MAG TPA: hypothetical protein VF173_13500 [Thermoanaerobaculia bacterium]|nr:hypothetical protein [Thermoanaerobaculia bacterium]
MQTRALDRIHFVTRHFNGLQGFRYWVPLGLIALSVGGTTYFENPQFLILRAVLFLGAFVMALSASWYYKRTFGEVEPQTASPAREVETLSIYCPAGPTPRLGGFQRMSPMVRSILIPLGLAVVLFTVFQTIRPDLIIDEDESLVQPPWATLSVSLALQDGPWTWPMRTHSTNKAMDGQLMYALLGSCFFGIWLGRGRRLSQSYYLGLGIVLLGLAAFGTFLGKFYRSEGETARIVDTLLPAVTHLWVAVLFCGAAMILAGLLDHWQLARVLGKPAKETQS